MQQKLIHPQLSYTLTGLCFQTHKQLGRFCSERQYTDALEKLFKKQKILYIREKQISLNNKTIRAGDIPDFIIDNKIIIDIKAKKFITKDDYYQMQRYLQNAKLELGLIINFRTTYLKPKRVLNSLLFISGHSDAHSDHSDLIKQS
jgi:GxxExxY protein